jgi:uncharacterized protein (TIRG00374 family)
MKFGRRLVLLAGLGCVGYLVTVTGLDTLLEPARTLSWRLAIFVVFPYALVALLRTLAWRLVFVRAVVSMVRLFFIRLAGEAFNLGTASVGGEPLKVYLLRPWVPLAEASAAQVMDKTAITVGQVLFLAVGLAVGVSSFDLSHEFVRAMMGLLAVQIIVVAAFVLVQCVGLVGLTVRALKRLGLRTEGDYASGFLTFDRTLSGSYRTRWGAIVAGSFVHLAGWLAGSLEVYLVLRWLDVDAPFTAALAIDAFGTGIKFMAFAIPGALGVLEGGYMLVFSAFGLGSGLGLSFTLVRRLRMLAWSAAGLVALTLLRTAAAPVTTGAQET